jgi:hypothetical protein
MHVAESLCGHVTALMAKRRGFASGRIPAKVANSIILLSPPHVACLASGYLILQTEVAHYEAPKICAAA